jgi:hypothetical protein
MSEDVPEESDTRVLVGERRLVLRRRPDCDSLTVVEPGGQIAVTVVVTPEAVTLTIGGADLQLDIERSLSIRAQSVALHGRDGVTITTEGDLVTVGRSQSIGTTHGDIALDANDDVRLDGERILLNC